MDPVFCQLLNDFTNPKQQVSIICMGVKASGKSTKALALVRFCIEHGFFDEYFLFLPAFGKDIEGSYNWLDQFKEQVTIFSEYNPVFAEWLISRPPEEVAKNKKGRNIFR